MQVFLFPAMEEEIGEMTWKMQEFVMLVERLHETMITENYKEKITEYANYDSVKIDGRERACRHKEDGGR